MESSLISNAVAVENMLKVVECTGIDYKHGLVV